MRRGLSVALVLGLLASGLAATPVLAATPTTTVLSVTPASPEVGEWTCLQADVTTDVGAWTNGGQVTFSETTSGTPVVLAYRTMDWMPAPSQAFYCSSDLTLGSHTYLAEFVHPDPSAYAPSSDDISVEIGKATPNVTLGVVDTIETHHDLAVQVGVTSTAPQGISGTAQLWREGGAGAECSGTVVSNAIDCTVSGLAIGTYSFYGKYLGDAQTAAGDGDSYEVTVVADVVHASSVGIQYATFYPARDSYRDTLKISGSRQEPLTTTIRIYRPTGSLLKTVALGKASGAYAYAWTGRDSSGAVLPEGKYKIVQSLNDGYTTKAVTSYVQLSRKHLIWHSAAVIKKGSAISSYGDAGNGSVAVNSAGTLRLKAPSPGYDAAAAGWQFGLVSGISYRQIQVSVYASHPLTAGGETRLGSQNFATCGYNAGGDWYESCFDSWKSVGNSFGSTAWYSTKVLTSTHRYGRTVRSFVVTYAGTTFVYKARVTYQYATLGY
jgi:FlgD Ig-like domain